MLQIGRDHMIPRMQQSTDRYIQRFRSIGRKAYPLREKPNSPASFSRAS